VVAAAIKVVVTAVMVVTAVVMMVDNALYDIGGDGQSTPDASLT
jgi:hypothetical protein